MAGLNDLVTGALVLTAFTVAAVGVAGSSGCDQEVARIDHLESQYDETLAAAENGDCETAVELAGEIDGADPQFYESYLAENRSLRCTPVPKPPVIAVPPQPPPPPPARTVADDEFDACRTHRVELLKEAYAITDAKARGDYLVTIPKCYRP